MFLFSLVRKLGFVRTLKLTGALLAVAAFIAPALYVYLTQFTPEQRIVRHHLSATDEKSNTAIDTRLKPLADLFAKGRKGSKAFAAEALSWNGKWELIKGMVRGGESHRLYLSEAFGRHVFTSDQLRDAMESAVSLYLVDVEGYEAEMLVKIRVDLADPSRPDKLLPAHLSGEEEFRREYRKLSERVITDLHLDLGVTVGRELGIMIASDVAAQAALQAARAAATEMGVNAGILGTGAASTVATLGLGIVVAYILDAIVDQIFKLAGHDPAAKIEKLVCKSIDKMEAALIQDSGVLWLNKKGSLRERMEELHESRSKLRRETINRLMKEGEKR
jgi:hypothetical protein